jgi:hypothetical protein
MPRQGRYPDELRERAVRMVLEHQGEYGSQREAICSVAETRIVQGARCICRNPNKPEQAHEPGDCGLITAPIPDVCSEALPTRVASGPARRRAPLLIRRGHGQGAAGRRCLRSRWFERRGSR